MSDFMESAKNFVNAAVSRTSWEAQKQLRLRGLIVQAALYRAVGALLGAHPG